MREDWSKFVEKIKKFFGNRKVLIVLIVAATFLIIVGFFSLIYFKDQPKFVPENIREDIREGVKGAIAEPLKAVAPSVGQALEDAAYQAPEPNGSSNNSNGSNSSGATSSDTSTWQTYKNEKYGYELKYPEGIKTSENVSNDFLSSVSFWSGDNYGKQINGVFPEFEININASNINETAIEWVNKQNTPIRVISDIKEINKGSHEWIKAIEAGDPDHVIYVLKVDDKIYKLSTSLEEPEYIDEILGNLKAS